MNRSIASARQSDPVRDLDTIRPSQAKASLRQSDAVGSSESVGPTLISVTKDAALAHFGSVKATAYALGEGAGLDPLDPSLMMREFDAGKFGRLNHASDQDRAAIAVRVAEDLLKHFAPLATPMARARQQLRDIHQRVNEVEQLLDYMAS